MPRFLQPSCSKMQYWYHFQSVATLTGHSRIVPYLCFTQIKHTHVTKDIPASLLRGISDECEDSLVISDACGFYAGASRVSG